jgi:hypothetical protein
MKKNKKKNEFLDQLRKVPIVQVACEKIGLSRTSIYRWREEDEEFRKEMEKAIADGEAFVNDMSESQLLTLIKEKNWAAISFWLRYHHPAYANTIKIKHSIDEEMSPEQAALAQKALELAGNRLNIENDNPNNDG